MDLRSRVVGAYEAGEGSYDELAKRFDVGRASVSRWLRLKRETGGLARRPPGGGQVAKLDGKGQKVLRQLVAVKSDSTRGELAKQLEAQVGVRLSVATVGRTLRRLGFTRKKRRYTPRKETPRES